MHLAEDIYKKKKKKQSQLHQNMLKGDTVIKILPYNIFHEYILLCVL